MATSSAIQLADLALVWDNRSGSADLALLDADLASEAGLVTAVLLSLWLDRRAEPDDQPPSGDDSDRRGSWMDELADVPGDRLGSRLWLLDRSVRSSEVPRRAEEYVREALAWMLEDRVVASIDVETEATAQALLIGVTLHRPGRDPVSLRFAHVWDHLS
ncbi:MAG TPA: phage GP46 family protein [Kofleriaceae bacterium]|nr:phage GP46 family protein [Kofleriaceae bacterium]